MAPAAFGMFCIPLTVLLVLVAGGSLDSDRSVRVGVTWFVMLGALIDGALFGATVLSRLSWVGQ